MLRALILAAAAAALVGAGAAGAKVDPKAPQQRHTATDTKLAGAIALERSDLAAGWKVEKQTPSPPCSSEPDESQLIETARLDPSFVYQDGVTSVGSEVDVFKTAAQARRDWALSTLRLVAACVLEGAKSGLGKHVTVTLESSQRLAPPPIAPRSLHYRLVLAVHSTRTLRIVSDVIAIGRGRVSVVLHSLTVSRPLPAAAVDVLAVLLAKRLHAVGGGVSS
ncbi:MAG: hypothetical protein ACYDCH_06130 [Gaiellaceae bacterium]